MATIDSAAVRDCIALLHSRNVRVCVFDMDLTAVAAHSQGCLLRSNLDDYLRQATPDFLALVPHLYAAGFGLAVATHSDEAEYGGHVQPATHILGEELVRALLNYHFATPIASAFFVVAYNPRVRKAVNPNDLIKRYHMRQILQHFDTVSPQQVVFFDDIEETVRDCCDYCNVRAIQVDNRIGFQCRDIIEKLK